MKIRWRIILAILGSIGMAIILTIINSSNLAVNVTSGVVTFSIFFTLINYSVLKQIFTFGYNNAEKWEKEEEKEVEKRRKRLKRFENPGPPPPESSTAEKAQEVDEGRNEPRDHSANRSPERGSGRGRNSPEPSRRTEKSSTEDDSPTHS